MVICHLCLNGPYTEGYNYQENLIPKYHVKQGHTVYQIVTPYEWKENQIVVSNEKRYVNKNGVEIIRCNPKRHLLGGTRFDRYPELWTLLSTICPDVLFIHDVQFLDARVVANYLKKHRNCIAYEDNHCDYTNSARNLLSKIILHGIIWRHTAHVLNPYVRKFYGVSPARVDFLLTSYKLPSNKCELLVMGADDELVEAAQGQEVRERIRSKYNISYNDFLIVTGGKVNQNRPEILNLIDAVKNNNNERIKLLFFGSVDDNYKSRFDELIKNENKIIFCGWVDSSKTYEFFSAADLVVFPGLHSVMWEQAVAMGVPCVFRDIKGYHHVNLGGNALFMTDTSSTGINTLINSIVNDPNRYAEMKDCAVKKGMTTFSYSNIAKKCIEGE